jgi:tetratricopeptide (TPR) repeat protein
VLRRWGRGDSAAEAYQRATDLRPDWAKALVNLGVTLRELGRTEEAVEAYRRAIAAQPDEAEAHYNLGVALQGQGRDSEAVEAYRRAATLRPGDGDTLANLGAALLATGRVSEALSVCQRRVELEPDSAPAHDALAAALLGLGRPEAAVAASRRALALDAGHTDAQIRLGDGLRELGRIDEAAAVFESAAEVAPGNALAWVGLGLSLQEAGRGPEALRAIDQALVADPHSAAAWSVRGGLKTFTPDDPDFETLSGLLARAAAAPAGLMDRLDLEFTLGKAFMDIGDAAQAFARLESGNRLMRATLSYDVGDDIAEFEAIVAGLKDREASALAARGDPSDRPVFIVGMPRSGSTLVEQILASHPLAHGAGELTALEAILIDRLGATTPPIVRARRLGTLSPEDLEAVGRAYVAMIATLAPDALRVTDKMPANFRFAGLIRLILPNARIVHCRRDPIDTCLSCYAHRFTRGQPFTYDLRELGLYYRAYDALMSHWRGLLPADRFMEVRYEDVVDDLEGQARRLIAFCGLPWDDACLAFHRTRRTVRTASVNQVRQPIYRTSVARWKPYEAYLGPLLAALSGP